MRHPCGLNRNMSLWVSMDFLQKIRMAVVAILFFGTVLLPLHGHAREVRVGIGFAIPPYVIKNADSGIEVDVVRQALNAAGYQAKFMYLPNLRLPVAFAQGKVDCIAVNVSYDLAGDTGTDVYPSDTTVVFQNYAITVGRHAPSIKSIGDLAGKEVLGFNNASK